MENGTKQQTETIVVVRAMPHPPYKHRWAGLEIWVNDERDLKDRPAMRRRPGKHALPWPKHEIKVRLVDEPTPFDPDANGGVPTEISPKTLAMLKRDERIMVQVLSGGAGVGDPAEIVRAKTALLEKDEEVLAARQELAQAGEQIARDRDRHQIIHESTQKQAIAAGIRVNELEAEVAMLRQQLEKKPTPAVKK